MPRHRAPTIREQGGLLPYITKLQEKYAIEHPDKQDILSGTQIIAMLDTGASDASIGKIIDRIPSTVKHWREVREDELTHGPDS